MNICFEKIVIKNFLSIGYAEIDFRNLGYVLVQGKNFSSDDNASSNGSGKSSIFESISWVLTGETVRGIKSSVANMKANQGAFVEIHFIVDDKKIKIIRTKDDKEYGTTLKLFVNGEDKSGKGIRDTSKILCDYLPDITPSLIGSVIILGQSLPQRFSNNTPSGRKEVLEGLSKSDFMIADLKDRIDSRKQLLLDTIKELEIEHKSLETKKELLESRLVSIDAELSSMGSSEDILKNIQQEQKRLQNKTDELNRVEQSLYGEKDIVQSLRDSYVLLLQKKSEKEKECLLEKQKAVSLVENKYESLLDDEQSRINELSVECKTLSNEIIRIDAITDVCPTCGQKLVGVEKPDSTGLKKELKKLKSKLEKENKLYNKLCSNRDSEVDEEEARVDGIFGAELKSIEENLTSVSNDGKTHKNIISSLEEERNEALGVINSLNVSILKLNTMFDSFNERLDSLHKEKKSLSEDILEICNKILYNTNRRDDYENRLEVINKFVTIVSRDFRGYLLKSLIEYIDKTAKEYSLCVFDTDKINFSLNGNNIDIGYCGKPYENLSSGERQKVDLIVQFSIRDMLCKYLGFGCNMLVLDEIFDGLDFVGCQKIIELISTKLPGIDSIFVITHRADLSIPYDRILSVEKNSQGISYVNDIL